MLTQNYSNVCTILGEIKKNNESFSGIHSGYSTPDLQQDMSDKKAIETSTGTEEKNNGVSSSRTREKGKYSFQMNGQSFVVQKYNHRSNIA